MTPPRAICWDRETLALVALAILFALFCWAVKPRHERGRKGRH